MQAVAAEEARDLGELVDDLPDSKSVGEKSGLERLQTAVAESSR